MKAEDIRLLKKWKDRDVYYGFNETSWDFTIPICGNDTACDTIPALIGMATPQMYCSWDRIGLQYDVYGRLHITHARTYDNDEVKFYSIVIENKELSLPTKVCLELIKTAIKEVLYQYRDKK